MSFSSKQGQEALTIWAHSPRIQQRVKGRITVKDRNRKSVTCDAPFLLSALFTISANGGEHPKRNKRQKEDKNYETGSYHQLLMQFGRLFGYFLLPIKRFIALAMQSFCLHFHHAVSRRVRENHREKWKDENDVKEGDIVQILIHC